MVVRDPHERKKRRPGSLYGRQRVKDTDWEKEETDDFRSDKCRLSSEVDLHYRGRTLEVLGDSRHGWEIYKSLTRTYDGVYRCFSSVSVIQLST